MQKCFLLLGFLGLYVDKTFKIGKTPEILGALSHGPPPRRCSWSPPGALRWASGPHPWRLACCCMLTLGLSGSINFFLTGTLSKITGNFKILAKALNTLPYIQNCMLKLPVWPYNKLPFLKLIKNLCEFTKSVYMFMQIKYQPNITNGGSMIWEVRIAIFTEIRHWV